MNFKASDKDQNKSKIGTRAWMQSALNNLLMPLQEQCSSFAASNVPHDDAVVRGSWEEQPLDWVPPQRSYATWIQKEKTDSLHMPLPRNSIMVWSAGSTQCQLREMQAALSNIVKHPFESTFLVMALAVI